MPGLSYDIEDFVEELAYDIASDVDAEHYRAGIGLHVEASSEDFEELYNRCGYVLSGSEHRAVNILLRKRVTQILRRGAY